MKNMPQKQHGGFMAITLFCLMLGFIGMLLIKVIPSYYNQWKVSYVFSDVPSNMHDILTSSKANAGFKEEAKRIIFTHLSIQNVTGIPVQNVVFTRADDGKSVKIELTYSDTIHLFFNADVTLSYDDVAVVQLP